MVGGGEKNCEQVFFFPVMSSFDNDAISWCMDLCRNKHVGTWRSEEYDALNTLLLQFLSRFNHEGDALIAVMSVCLSTCDAYKTSVKTSETWSCRALTSPLPQLRLLSTVCTVFSKDPRTVSSAAYMLALDFLGTLAAQRCHRPFIPETLCDSVLAVLECPSHADVPQVVRFGLWFLYWMVEAPGSSSVLETRRDKIECAIHRLASLHAAVPSFRIPLFLLWSLM